MNITMNIGENSYDIIVERGCLARAGELLNLDRRALIVTDNGVPREYVEYVRKDCREGYIFSFEPGEASKTLETYGKILSELLRLGFTRKDCVVAVGGGIPGDIAGFAAATYMRGIDFYNIPTTCLSQIDSSIGGKTAVNLDGVKNVVGAFKQPRRVLVDPELTKTLPERQIANGLAEALKMSLTSDAELFSVFENGNVMDNIDLITERSLMIKCDVVELDEKENGLRRILNFGHTIGHGIEVSGGGLYHGECVALGMLPMCPEGVSNRIIPVLEKLGLPTHCNCPADKIISAAIHDKKCHGDRVTVVYVPEPGKYELRDIKVKELEKIITEAGI